MGFDLSTLLKVGAVGGQVAGGVIQARGQQEQLQAQADAADYNARLALRTGTAEGSRIRTAGRREIARQRVALAASDVRAEGSPLELLAQNAATIERDAAFAEIEARRTARLEQQRARGFRSAARRTAGTALLGGATGALTTGYALFRERGP